MGPAPRTVVEVVVGAEVNAKVHKLGPLRAGGPVAGPLKARPRERNIVRPVAGPAAADVARARGRGEGPGEDGVEGSPGPKVAPGVAGARQGEAKLVTAVAVTVALIPGPLTAAAAKEIGMPAHGRTTMLPQDMPCGAGAIVAIASTPCPDFARSPTPPLLAEVGPPAFEASRAERAAAL